MYTIFLALLGITLADPLLWGPYRANLYFGMRPRIPHSLMTGLMWFNTGNFAGIQKLRHDALQDDDTVYTWTQYDTRLGGTQEIRDYGHSLNLTIDLAKNEDGDAWTVRIRGHQAENEINTLIWYTGLEGEGKWTLDSGLDKDGVTDPHFKGVSPELGKFDLKVTESSRNQYPESDHIAASEYTPHKWQYTTLHIPTDNVWKAKDVYLTLLQDHVNVINSKYDPETTPLAGFPAWVALSLNNDDTLGGNMQYIQKTFKGPFEVTLQYNNHKADFKKRDKALDAKFKGLQGSEYTAFAKELLSNLGANIGYFYGDSLIAEEETPDMVEHTSAHELYTCCPSRGFFPRGFYWDEGFQLLGLIDYDLELVLEILQSWFNLMDENGWIAREQILGAEARGRVPKDFQVQVTNVANPPTLITFLVHLGKIDDPAIKKQLKDVFPQLETHFKWFRQSQRGKLLDYDREAHSMAEGYRWRGRTATHVLASGIDDYPRSKFISDGELNVDLLAWIGAMADALSSVSEVVGEPRKAAEYAKIAEDVKLNLVDLHWNSDANAFCDVAVDDYEEDVHECHIGYVTHLPFFLRLVDPKDTHKLKHILKQLGDPEQLWGKAGIRSLSKQDEFFGAGENYWRGSIWFNMNYLALDALRYYHEKAGPEIAQLCADLYAGLRRNVIENTYEQWLETGRAWEQYEALSGKGKGVEQFTGWTSLVANVLTWPEELGGDKDEL